MTGSAEPDEVGIADGGAERLSSDRRRFIMRAMAASAVTVPVVSSFSLTGMRPSLNMAFGASGTSVPNSRP